MKKVFKFTLAALAATVLASCSTDDLSSTGIEKDQLKKGDLIVEVEGMMNPLMTRTVYTPEMKLFWQDRDNVYTYDESLLNYDVYEYNLYAGYFEQKFRQDGRNVPENKVAYATYLGDTRPDNTWNVNNGETYLRTTIPYSMNWNSMEIGNNDVRDTAYVNKLPMWGTAKINDEHRVVTKLMYLTGILRINLENVPTNVKALYIRGWDNEAENRPSRLTGSYQALIAKNGIPHDGVKCDIIAQLDEKTADFSSERAEDKNYIIVDLTRGLRHDSAMVLVPIMPGDYEKLQIVASTNEAKYLGMSGIGYDRQLLTKAVHAEIDRIIKANPTTDANNDGDKYVIWNKPAMGVKRGVMYTMDTKKFYDGGETVNDVNLALERRYDEKIKENPNLNSLELTTTGIMKVGGQNGDTLKIPAMKGVKSLDLDLKGWTWQPKGAYWENNQEGTGYTNKYVLNLVAKEGSELEELTLRVGQHEYTHLTNLYINLPNVNVKILGGGFEDVELGEMYEANTAVGQGGNRFVRDGLVVNGLTIGLDANNAEYTKIKAISVNDATKGQIKIGKQVEVAGKYVQRANDGAYGTYGLTLERKTKVSNIVVNGVLKGNLDATVEGSIVSGENVISVKVGDGATLGGLKTAQKSLDVLKDVTIEETLEAREAAEITITGKSKVGNSVISEKGDVTIAIEGMSSRSTSDRTIAKVFVFDGHTLNLQGGYITTVTAMSRNNQGNEVVGGNITITNHELNGEATAINELSGCVAKNIKSTWGGKVAEIYKNPKQIYTASQFVSIDGSLTTAQGNTYYLNCSPNMGGKSFQGIPSLYVHFYGNENTISDMKITKTGTTNANAGLFGVVGGINAQWEDSLVIKDLTIENAVIEGKGNNVGVLFGQGDKNISVEGVTIDGATVKAEETKAKEANDWNVGGVAGKYTSTVEGDTLYLKGVTVKDVTIEGRYHLGGLVGEAMNVVGEDVKVIGDTKFSVGNRLRKPDLDELITSKWTVDMNAGTVGKYFGYIKQGTDFSTKVELTDAVEKVAEKNYNRTDLGFKNRWLENDFVKKEKDENGKYTIPVVDDKGKVVYLTEEETHYWYGSTNGVVGETEDKVTFRVNYNNYKYVSDAKATGEAWKDYVRASLSNTGHGNYPLNIYPEGNSTDDRMYIKNTYIRWNM